MGPTSPLLLAVLIACAVALVGVAIFRLRRWWLRVASAVLGLALAVTSGLVIVNDFYGYYQTWSAVGTDFFGGAPDLGKAPAVRASGAVVEAGRVERLTLSGGNSHISRVGYVYLPPQYNQPGYRTVRFPVLELLHGTPGKPTNWLVQLRVPQLLDRLIAAREMGPMLLVMPSTNPAGSHWQECTDGPRGRDDTYLSHDVPAVIRARYRVSGDPAQWGLLGMSSGGYCAANFALRHRSWFGSAAVLDGYFRAQDGPAGAALGGNPALEAANSPLTLARSLRPGAAPMPAFWVSVGTGDRNDLIFERAFVPALERAERVTSVVQPGGRHTFYALARQLPEAFTWSWQQLAPPNLQRAFPLTASPPPIYLPPLQLPHPPVPVSCSSASPRSGTPSQPTAAPSQANACRE